MVDTFVHPHGFCRNVLATADLTLRGTARLADREVYVLRADHPRSTEVLTDRPDRWLELAVDRLSGLVLLLAEHVGDQLTRHAEVTRWNWMRPSATTCSCSTSHLTCARSTEHSPADSREPEPPWSGLSTFHGSGADQAISSSCSIAASSSGVPWTLGPLNQFLAETSVPDRRPAEDDEEHDRRVVEVVDR